MPSPTTLPTDVRLMALATSALGWALVALVLGATGLWAVRHPVWDVRALVVDGDLQHQNEAIFRAHMGSRLRGNFLTLNLQEVQAVFESVPWVRKATVQRVFPNRLHVTLEEHQAMAWWEQAGTTLLLNRQGEVFEASAESEDTDHLPELVGPQGQAAQVKQVYEALVPLFALVDMQLERLELTAQGSWRAGLDNGAQVEMGRGDRSELVARVGQFTRTLPQVTREHGRSLESADLRYPAAYAVRLRGVTTLAPGQTAKPARPAPPKPRPAERR